LSFLCVSEGELVRRGDSLGAVGNSGTIAGVRKSREEAHLHLEIWVHRVGSPEVYLGEGMEEQHLRQLLQEIFSIG
jgi:murein DD-endopeptidase MepM/ murein hydrolase activator NlpD